MQFSNGVKPSSKVHKETIEAESVNNRILFNGKNGIYPYEKKYYIIGENMFLQYENLDDAKEDLFGERESEMFDPDLEEEVLGEMLRLPGLPASLSAFTFPLVVGELTEIHFDADLCYWFLDEGTIRKTLFSAAEEGEIPEVSYIVEFAKDFFLVVPVESSVRGRFSSVEAVLQKTTYASIGNEPYEEIDYVSFCLLDREANDEEVDYIDDRGLTNWIEMHANYEGSFKQDEGLEDLCSYDIYEFMDGYFVVDPDERSVLGKFTSYESAFAGVGDEYYEDDEEEENENEEEQEEDED